MDRLLARLDYGRDRCLQKFGQELQSLRRIAAFFCFKRHEADSGSVWVTCYIRDQGVDNVSFHSNCIVGFEAL